MTAWVLATLIGYLLGSIPVGYLVGRSRGIDVRKYGSGATGGTNILRTMGVVPALLTGLCDLGKGILAAYVGYRIGDRTGYALAGFMAVVGHSYPVWLGFRGGKSVATGAGVLLLFHPYAFLGGLATAVAAIAATRFVSLGSLLGALVYLVPILVSGAPTPDKLLGAGVVLVIYIRHWENMKRLAAGKENKLGQKAQPRVQP